MGGDLADQEEEDYGDEGDRQVGVVLGMDVELDFFLSI